MYQSIKPLDLISRYSPELFVSLKDLSVGLILRIAVSVDAIGGGSIFSMNREAPRLTSQKLCISRNPIVLLRITGLR